MAWTKILDASAIPEQIYTACVCLAMLHGSETWGLDILDLKWLHRNDRAMTH